MDKNKKLLEYEKELRARFKSSKEQLIKNNDFYTVNFNLNYFSSNLSCKNKRAR